MEGKVSAGRGGQPAAGGWVGCVCTLKCVEVQGRDEVQAGRATGQAEVCLCVSFWFPFLFLDGTEQGPEPRSHSGGILNTKGTQPRWPVQVTPCLSAGVA